MIAALTITEIEELNAIQKQLSSCDDPELASDVREQRQTSFPRIHEMFELARLALCRAHLSMVSSFTGSASPSTASLNVWPVSESLYRQAIEQDLRKWDSGCYYAATARRTGR